MNKKRFTRFGTVITVIVAVVALIAGAWNLPAAAQEDPGDKGKPEWRQKIQPSLMAAVQTEGVQVAIVEFDKGLQPDLTPAYSMDWQARGQWVFQTLSAARTQRQDLLQRQGVNTAHCFLATNSCAFVQGTNAMVEAAAKVPEVTWIRSQNIVELPPDEITATLTATEISPESLEWNILKIQAPNVWALGTDGQEVVVGTIDTGAQFDHPAIVSQYRGTTGIGVYSHAFSWIDPSRICPNATVPCDNVGHGTHVLGTVLGVYGIGVAPGARWIAAKGCEYTSCSEYALLSSADWMLAPTKLDGSGADPDKRPQIVSNSWGGGGNDPWFQSAVNAWQAAGIIPIFAAGNSGRIASPGDYANVIGVGATDVNDSLAGFSGRGPCSGGRICPDVVAPGVNVRSSVPDGYANFSGTSMATPHVAGVTALIMDANSGLIGQFEAIRDILKASAFRLPGVQYPNNSYGWGRIDALAAVLLAGGGHTGFIEGKILDASTGQPIAGANVSAGQGVYTMTITSGTDGSYQFQLAAGEIFSLTASAWTYFASTTQAAAAEGTTVVMDIALDREPIFPIVGTVYANDPNGAPKAQPHATMSVIAGAPGKISVNTNPNGIYEIPGLPAGTYTLQASTSICTGSNAVVTTTVDVPTSGPVDLLLLGRPTYAVSQTAFNWIDVASSGIKLGASYYDDRWSPVTLAQPLSYWGRTISQIGVSSNGFVMTDLTNAVPLGSYFHPVLGRPIANGVVAPYWGDLDPGRSGDGSGVWALETADFVAVEWATYEYPGSQSGIWRRFEAVLFRNGSVMFQYKDSPRGERRWQTGLQGWSTSDLVLWGAQPSSGSALLLTPTLASCDVQSVTFLPIVAKAPPPTPTPDPNNPTPTAAPLPPWATDTPAPTPAP